MVAAPAPPPSVPPPWTGERTLGAKSAEPEAARVRAIPP
eukprot:CAMPEP_0178440630 /NCGR_PEP_ID=MMETSP0689_2-20121128/36904_1 /TAXON_ID=160604 /ORGANISM="Amphidinium massartii, Strain CS-259" /LENGTH=38 /DNA_ID= /DNA_START= /DNA_END= /DNA_ORIENTATION=